MANRKILLGLTTITDGEWRNKVKEIDQLGLKEIALFPTCLNSGERKELYSLLEKTGLSSIPHVHLREDMESWELDYFVEKYQTEVFNVHAQPKTVDFLCRNIKYKNIIFLENRFMDDNFAVIAEHCGGLCLDLSHWEDYGQLQKIMGYEALPGLIIKYKIGINHVSAVRQDWTADADYLTSQDYHNFSSHNLADLSELDYVKKYKNYLADIISVELENPLKKQLEAKKYLEKNLELFSPLEIIN